MSNKVCKDIIRAFSGPKTATVVEPSHICAGGRFASNPSTNLENDSCQVCILKITIYLAGTRILNFYCI